MKACYGIFVGAGGMQELLTKVMPGSLVVGHDRGRGGKRAAVANKPVNRSGGQRFLGV
jgi:hypothetical protein